MAPPRMTLRDAQWAVMQAEMERHQRGAAADPQIIELGRMAKDLLNRSRAGLLDTQTYPPHDSVLRSLVAPRLESPSPAPAPAAPQQPEYDDPDPGYGYTPHDLSTDRGRVTLNDPRMVRAEERDKALAEGRSLAAADVVSARRRGRKRRATGLYDLLTGGRPEDRDFFETRRTEMMNVDLGDGVMGTRLSPHSDTVYSPATGELVDATPRRVPDAIRARREAKAKGLRSYVHPKTGVSLPTGPVHEYEGPPPGTGTGGGTIRLTDKTAEGVRGIRQRREERLRASREALAAKRRQVVDRQGRLGVPTVHAPPSVLSQLPPQMRTQLQQRAVAGDKGAIAFLSAAAQKDKSNQDTQIGIHRAETERLRVMGDQPVETNDIPDEDRQAFGLIFQSKATDTPLSSKYREAAELWNAAGSYADQQTPEAFVAYANRVNPGRWAGADQNILRKWWHMRKSQVTGKPALTPEGKFSDAEQFHHVSANPLAGDPATDKVRLGRSAYAPPTKSGSGRSAPGVTETPEERRRREEMEKLQQIIDRY